MKNIVSYPLSEENFFPRSVPHEMWIRNEEHSSEFRSNRYWIRCFRGYLPFLATKAVE